MITCTCASEASALMCLMYMCMYTCIILHTGRKVKGENECVHNYSWQLYMTGLVKLLHPQCLKTKKSTKKEIAHWMGEGNKLKYVHICIHYVRTCMLMLIQVIIEYIVYTIAGFPWCKFLISFCTLQMFSSTG